MRTGVRLLAAMLFLLAVPHAPASAYSLTLTAQDIREALEYGERHRDAGTGTLRLPPDAAWKIIVRSEEPVDLASVVWVTPFLELAMHRSAANRPLANQEVQDRLRVARDSVLVIIVLLTREDVPTPSLRLLVYLQDGRVLRPSVQEIDRFGFDRTRGMYLTNVQARFPYHGGIVPTQSAKVVVGWGVRTLTAEFDLSSLR
jgi:hypothetical protein